MTAEATAVQNYTRQQTRANQGNGEQVSNIEEMERRGEEVNQVKQNGRGGEGGQAKEMNGRGEERRETKAGASCFMKIFSGRQLCLVSIHLALYLCTNDSFFGQATCRQRKPMSEVDERYGRGARLFFSPSSSEELYT